MGVQSTSVGLAGLLAVLAPAGSVSFGQAENRPAARAQLSELELARSPQVELELKLSDDQQQAIRTLVEDSARGVQEMVAEFRALPFEERLQKMDALREKMEAKQEEVRQRLDELFEPAQRERFFQIVLQVRGYDALYQKAVADAVELTEEQRQKVKSLRADLRTKAEEIFKSVRAGAVQQAEAMEKIAGLRNAALTQAKGVLTAAQQKKFEQLKGKKFEVNPFRIDLNTPARPAPAP
jgi:hypothetical protein